MENELKNYISQGIENRKALLANTCALDGIQKLSETCLSALNSGNKILIAGNGGSAADSQHIAAEFVSRFRFDRPSLPALALTTDTSALTAIGNDYGFRYLFSRQIEGLGQEGDVFLGITTSGKSENITLALSTAIEKGMRPVVLTGDNSAQFDDRVICVRVPSAETCFIQEMHITICHFVCDFVEKSIFG